MDNKLSRRAFTLGLSGLSTLPFFASTAQALSVDQARSLINQALAEVNSVINSGKSESAMLRDFERVFVRYGDVPTIARSCLGPAARQASPAELRSYTAAFQGYIARKYGRRFREFIGSQIEVKSARPVRNYFEVITTVKLRGKPPYQVSWLVSDRSGRNKFFNLLIEGVNMLSTERAEIGAMLDRRRGDIAALTADLQRA